MMQLMKTSGEYNLFVCVCMCVFTDVFLHSWFLHILAYVTELLPSLEDRNKFIVDLVAKWQTYILALFEDYDPNTASDTGVYVEGGFVYYTNIFHLFVPRTRGCCTRVPFDRLLIVKAVSETNAVQDTLAGHEYSMIWMPAYYNNNYCVMILSHGLCLCNNNIH